MINPSPPQFSVADLLRKLPTFKGVSEEQLDRLAGYALRREFASGQILFVEGDPSAGLWFLESGRVKAYKLSVDGREYIMRFFGPSETFNDLAALDGASNPVSTMAVTDIVAWVIPSAVFGEELRADPDLALAVLRGFVGRARFLVSRVEDLALHPVTARLAHFLLDQIDSSTLSHPAITRALIANHLATTPESISRSLRVLEKAGAIRFDRHCILIVSADILKKQSQL